MTEIHQAINGPLPENFDTREKWRNLISPIRDQGDCAASWAFSTTGMVINSIVLTANNVKCAEKGKYKKRNIKYLNTKSTISL